MAAKLILDDFEPEKNLWFAITCTSSGPSLAYLLNQTLEIELMRAKEDAHSKILNQTFTFPQYEFEDDWGYFTVILRENASLQKPGQENAVRLLKRPFPVDFILQVSCDAGIRVKSALSSLQQKGEIQFYTAIEPKNKNEEAQLYFELLDA